MNLKNIIVRIKTDKGGDTREEVFSVEGQNSILIGRDPASDIQIGEDSDTVSRRHALIEIDAASELIKIVDAGSSNGVFLDGARVSGSKPLNHGGLIQLGEGGPELIVHFDPEPPLAAKATRVVRPPAATRMISADESAQIVPERATVIEAPASQKSGVGKETVERMITHQQKGSNNRFAVVGGIAALVVVGVVAGLFFKGESDKQALREVVAEGQKASEQAMLARDNAASLTEQVATKYASSTVKIEVIWKLVHASTNQTIFHEHSQYKFKNGKTVSLPVYVQLEDGSIEPKLTLNAGAGKAIGSTHTGSGFVVSPDGFILTNRHVAATWQTRMADILSCPCYLILNNGEKHLLDKVTPKLSAAVGDWIPARSGQVGGSGGGFRGGAVGQLLVLDVVFSHSKDRHPARLVKVSDTHDVALIKMDTPTRLTPVDMPTVADLSPLREGQDVVVMGYPAASPSVYLQTGSVDPFNRKATITDVPSVTVSPGVVSRVIKGTQERAGGNDSGYVSAIGDAYQLDINATGAGNSGGPMFDRNGKVAGIFFAGNERLTFAIPIKYGIDLLSPQSSTN